MGGNLISRISTMEGDKQEEDTLSINVNEIDSPNLAVEVKKTDVQKVVIVVGTTGSGKSTLINMLFNNEYTKDACKAPCPTDSTADSVTKKTKWLISPASAIVFGDTVGLGDPSQSDLEVVFSIKGFIRRFDAGVNSIIIVARYGRWSLQDRANISAISEIFDSTCYKHCILVLTFYDGKKDAKSIENSIAQWAREDNFVNDFLKLINKRVIVTNNSIEDNDYESITRELRRNCLLNLRNFIDLSTDVVGPKPRTSIEMISILLRIYMGIHKIKNYTERMQNAMRYINQSAKEVYAAECPICQSEIMLDNFAQTECKHSFHISCINVYSKQGDISCPMCRNPVRKIIVTQAIKIKREPSTM